MERRAKLALAWPALLKLAEQGVVAIYGRGINESGQTLYQLRECNGLLSGLLTEAKLLDRLAKEVKEGKE